MKKIIPGQEVYYLSFNTKWQILHAYCEETFCNSTSPILKDYCILRLRGDMSNLSCSVKINYLFSSYEEAMCARNNIMFKDFLYL